MKKNRAKSFTSGVDLLYEEELHELTNAILENKDRSSAFSDPFEDYIDSIRTKTHANPQMFCARLIKGYNVLLNELQNLESSSN